MSSDIAIGQFRFLERLLLVHGHWCYRRISSMVASSLWNPFTKNRLSGCMKSYVLVPALVFAVLTSLLTSKKINSSTSNFEVKNDVFGVMHFDIEFGVPAIPVSMR